MAPLILLGACSGWFGESENEPLPGKRINILSYEQKLAPDPELKENRIVLPEPSPTPDWPQAGGYANHSMQHIAVGQSLRRVWKADAGAAASDEERFNSSPVIGGGRIFTLDVETQVSAFDATTGKVMWRAELTPDYEDDGHIPGGLAYVNGWLFVTTGFADVIALNAVTGQVIWRRRVGGPIRSAPTVRGGRLFVITVDNTLLALDAYDGSTLWTHSGNTEVASILGGASPAVDQGVVIAPFSSGELVALNVGSGRVLWTESLAASAFRSGEISTLSHIRGRPVIDRGRVFALNQGGRMVSVELRSGQRVWTRKVGGLESPWVAGDYIFVLTRDSEVVAMSRDDGRIHWVQPLPRFENPEDREDPITWTGPVLASNRLIVAGTQGQVLSISPYSGQILGREELDGGVSVPPVIANGTLYFLTDDAELIAYR